MRSAKIFNLSACVMLLTLGAFVFRTGFPGSANATLQQSQTQKISFSDIAHAYHGRLLDRNYKEIKLDRTIIEQLQDSMIESLTAQPSAIEYKTAGGQTIKPQITKPPLDRAYVEKVLNGFKFTNDERFMIKSLIIQQGIDAAPKQEQPEYQWRMDVVNERSVFFVDPKVWNPSSEVSRYVDLSNLSGMLGRIRRQLLTDTTYANTCRENNVPVPPDWPSGPTGSWTRLTPALPWQYNFLQSGPDTEVWTYEPPLLPSGDAPPNEGLCYALPRKHEEHISLLGIICQSKRTGKACFWDNIDIGAERDESGNFPRITGADVVLRIAEIKNGSNLAENCTACHRGSNAFLIHPNTVLGTPLNRQPDTRYSPIGQSSWSNPPPFSPLGSGRCASCHEIAEPTPNYCRILEQAADLTMPTPTWPVQWNPSSTTVVPAAGTAAYMDYLAYRAHIAFLKTRCP